MILRCLSASMHRLQMAGEVLAILKSLIARFAAETRIVPTLVCGELVSFMEDLGRAALVADVCPGVIRGRRWCGR